MPRASTSRDRILRHLLDINRHVHARENGLRSLGPGTGRRRLSLHSPQSALAFETGVAFSWVNKVLRELQAHGCIDPVQPLRVLDPEAAFAWWRPRRNVPKIHGFQAKDPHLMALRLKERGVDHAVTTYYGENHHLGHLFARRLDTYVRADDLMHARHVIIDHGGQLGGTNFRLWTGDDGVVDDRQLGGPTELDYAMVPQIILDLYHEGGSAAEAADIMVRKEFLHADARVR